MKIIRETGNKKQHISLLLLADEQEEMIDKYLDRGIMYLLEDDGIKAECVVTDEGNGILEIKNLAVEPTEQRKGYGRKLIDFVVQEYGDSYPILQVGTGDSPLTIPLYESCGFERSHIVKDFFIENYDFPIFEEGVQLVDMIYLQKRIDIDHGDDYQITYEKLTQKHVDEFIQLRINQLREERATGEIDLTPNLRNYYSKHMEDGTFVSWLAMQHGKIVGTSGISFVEKPPYFGCPSGIIGLLSSMYTDSRYRRRGIAKTLLSLIVEEAKAHGAGTIQITASDMGVLLYTDFGFQKNGNFMQYKL